MVWASARWVGATRWLGEGGGEFVFNREGEREEIGDKIERREEEREWVPCATWTPCQHLTVNLTSLR